MIYSRYLWWPCALLLLGIVGCASAQTTQVPNAPALQASPLVPTAPSTVGASATSTLASTSAPTASSSARWNFDSDTVGGLPKGAEVFSGTWVVRAEPGVPSSPNGLCQTGSATYPAILLGDPAFSDLAASVRFKPISGNTDRAAGIIFRIQDKDNYYIVRANALEDNVIIFKYVRGSRLTIKEGAAKVAAGQWQELGVEMIGNRIRGLINGVLAVETTDDTFKSGGKIGLWTKADSVTCFDDLQITPR